MNEYTPRPMNQFMCFAYKHRPIIRKKFPHLCNSQISKILGQDWANLTENDKKKFKQEATNIKANHQRMYPNYKYKPKTKGQRIKKLRKKSPIKLPLYGTIPNIPVIKKKFIHRFKLLAPIRQDRDDDETESDIDADDENEYEIDEYEYVQSFYSNFNSTSITNETEQETSQLDD